MPNLLWEVKTLICDVCRERPMKKTIEINGKWQGVCDECEPQKEKLDK